MSAKILNGEAIANDLRKQIRQQISAQRSKSRRAPALAVVLIGDDPASHIYVRNKKRACQEVGISAIDHSLPDSTSQEYLLNLITKLNLDPNIDGILVQLPLPAHIEPLLILDKIDPHKDVDGFHPYNLGRLAQGHPLLSPCTPAGIMQLLQHTKAELRGKIAVMVGISNIVGMPMILELMHAGATVIACHKDTVDLEAEVRRADLLISATGVPELIKGSWIKQDSIVIDVGMNHTKDRGLVGDIEFDIAKERAEWITPVPGGVGPMTVANLLNNTLKAYTSGTSNSVE